MNGNVELLVIFLAALANVSVADTRYECITGFGGGGGIGGEGIGDGLLGEGMAGEMFGMEADEMEEFGENEEMGAFGDFDGFGGKFGMGGVQIAFGQLSCPAGNRGSILVKRVSYGVSMFPGSCQTSDFCSVQHETGDSVAEKCNGKNQCTVNTLQPKILNCGQMSNYIHVEYECVDTWATFEICETVNTIARGASVIITSPGYLGTSNATGSGPQMCECILQSHDRADVYMDYLQTELASQGDTCPYEFVLLESKRNLTQSSIDKVMEVCGKKQTDGRWFEGAIRLTYASGGPMQKRGMLAKFTVDNIGNQPMMELECGKVDSASLQLQTRPVTAPATGGAGLGFFGMPFPMMPPMVPSLPVMPNMPLGFPGLSMSQPTLPTNVAPATGIQLLGRSPPVHTDFSNWNFRVAGEKTPSLTDLQTAKVQIPSNIFNQPTAEKPSAPAPNKQAVASKLIPAQAVNNNQRAGINVRQWSNGEKSPSIHNGKGRVFNDKDVATSEAPKPESGNDSGGMVALIFAVVGSVMILGSVGILAVNNYRKRQRIKRKEAEYAYGGSGSYTYGKGWETTSVGENNPAFQDDEEVYATVAEVEVYRSGGCDGGINPSIGIPAPAFPAKSRSNTDASSQGRPNPRILDDDYDSLSLSTTSLSSTEDEKPATEFGRQTQVSVVDFHRNFNDGITPDVSSTSLTKSSLTNPKCTSACLYASANKLSATGCTECSLTRPPRRSDASRGYDNNAGVNSKIRY